MDPPVGWERAGYVLRWTDDFNSGTVITSNRTISTVWKKLYTVTFRDPLDNKESVVTGVEEGTGNCGAELDEKRLPPDLVNGKL